MEGIEFSKKPRLSSPVMIVAWPGMGEVAFKAATYLVEKLKADEFATILPEEFFYLAGSFIQNGILDVPELPESKFYFWKSQRVKGRGKTKARDVIIFLSNAQPDLAKAEAYSQRIIQVAKEYHVKTIIGLAAMPQPIEHGQEARVWFAATSKAAASELKRYNLEMLTEGQISGMNGLFLGIAKRSGIDGFCLLAEIPLYAIQIENPRAALVLVTALSQMLNIQIDVGALKEQIQVMDAEISKLLEYLKTGASSGQPGPIEEEEVEKIKKALNQLTKLPVSMKDKIEKLFADAQQDISKARELKSELDTWGVYKDYEDRFLDLFRKSKGKGN